MTGARKGPCVNSRRRLGIAAARDSDPEDTPGPLPRTRTGRLSPPVRPGAQSGPAVRIMIITAVL